MAYRDEVLYFIGVHRQIMPGVRCTRMPMGLPQIKPTGRYDAGELISAYRYFTCMRLVVHIPQLPAAHTRIFPADTLDELHCGFLPCRFFDTVILELVIGLPAIAKQLAEIIHTGWMSLRTKPCYRLAPCFFLIGI